MAGAPVREATDRAKAEASRRAHTAGLRATDGARSAREAPGGRVACCEGVARARRGAHRQCIREADPPLREVPGD